MVAEMDRVCIQEALTYHASAAGYAPSFGNPCLAEETRLSPRLHPCWAVMPHHTAEMEKPRVLAKSLTGAGVRAVRLFPRLHRYSLAEWSAGELLSELAARAIVTCLDFHRSHWAEEVVDYDAIASICKQHPTLPVVLVREGIGSTRYLYPLLDRFENFYIELSYYQASGGVAAISRRFGAHGMLFGTGLPDYEAGPALSMIYFAELSFEEKKLVAGDNLRRLLAKVDLRD